MGGQVTVDSELGKGTTFTIDILTKSKIGNNAPAKSQSQLGEQIDEFNFFGESDEEAVQNSSQNEGLLPLQRVEEDQTIKCLIANDSDFILEATAFIL